MNSARDTMLLCHNNSDEMQVTLCPNAAQRQFLTCLSLIRKQKRSVAAIKLHPIAVPLLRRNHYSL